MDKDAKKLHKQFFAKCVSICIFWYEPRRIVWFLPSSLAPPLLLKALSIEALKGDIIELRGKGLIIRFMELE
jgi:hypothetical protein